ncbi:MAG: hypothetical protein IPL73_18685 [Candidatus Obscuribacter sp.]|nr:hypothetical protein [Candidatus Obscuribacter sp.]
METNTSSKFSFKTWLAAKGKVVSETESAKARLMRLVLQKGENDAATIRARRIYGNDSLVSFDAFKNFYGVDRAVYTIVNSYMLPATMGGETDKQASWSDQARAPASPTWSPASRRSTARLHRSRT